MYYDLDAMPASTGHAQPPQAVEALEADELYGQWHALGRDMGASDFSVLMLAPEMGARRLVPVLDSRQQGGSEISRSLCADPAEAQLARHVAETTLPLWCAAGPASPSPAARWMRRVDIPGLEGAFLGFPVHAGRDRKGAAMFSGLGTLPDERTLAAFHWRCCGLFGPTARRRAPSARKPRSISQRELQCLQLTANGLTSEHIAAKLGLSVHTANQYLANTAHKLDAVNRIHAVAKALRLGLID